MVGPRSQETCNPRDAEGMFIDGRHCKRGASDTEAEPEIQKFEVESVTSDTRRRVSTPVPFASDLFMALSKLPRLAC